MKSTQKMGLQIFIVILIIVFAGTGESLYARRKTRRNNDSKSGNYVVYTTNDPLYAEWNAEGGMGYGATDWGYAGSASGYNLHGGVKLEFGINYYNLTKRTSRYRWRWGFMAGIDAEHSVVDVEPNEFWLQYRAWSNYYYLTKIKEIKNEDVENENLYGALFLTKKYELLYTLTVIDLLQTNNYSGLFQLYYLDQYLYNKRKETTTRLGIGFGGVWHFMDGMHYDPYFGYYGNGHRGGPFAGVQINVDENFHLKAQLDVTTFHASTLYVEGLGFTLGAGSRL